MQLLLIRDDQTPAAPSWLYGELTLGGLITLQTMELPWVPDLTGWPCGEVASSCVPKGTYDLVLHDTVTHPQTWALVNPTLGVYHEPNDVPTNTVGRSACLIHSGNFAHDSKGCVLVGRSRGTLEGLPAILDSREALTELKAVLPWVQGHTLTIS